MAGYENLLTYIQCEETYDLTIEFCQRFLPGRELLRQREQMEQAARSAKQCIAEGATQKTSLKGYIKMLGISRGSLEELLKDYQDFAHRQKASLEEKFIKEGGYSETLFKKRLVYRKKQSV